jgi:hypothetical protein
LPFHALYRNRQNEAPYLPRQWYLSDAEMLQWVGKDGVLIRRTDKLDPSMVRGMILHHPVGFIHEMKNSYTILVAAGLEPEVERVIVIKELMHCYFGPDGGGIFATDSQMALESHLQKFFGNSFALRSHATEAENKALWMALAVICPENTRVQYRAKAKDDPNAIQELAEELRIPLHQAKALLSPQFDSEIKSILQ